jgi:hypothetical protein
MTAAAGPVRLAILGATGGIGGHLLSWGARGWWGAGW